METTNLEQVRVIFGEADSALRTTLTPQLSAEGFSPDHIMGTDRIADIREAVDGDRADLVVCDAELADGTFGELIHQIRHHEIGDNPFVGTITMIPTAEKQSIMASIDSGTDDVLIKPITGAQFMERFKLLTRERTPFVVTTDYIGPNRRKAHRPGTVKIPEFQVPNPLKAKVDGAYEKSRMQAEIHALVEVFNEQKIERHAYQIVYLIEHMLPVDLEGGVKEAALDEIDRLWWVANDISHRVADTRYAEWDVLCRSLVEAVGRVRKNATAPEPKDLDSLRNLAGVFKYQASPAEKLAQSG